MRIGKFEFGFWTPVYAALTLIFGVMLLITYSGCKEVVIESWYRDTIVAGIRNDDPEVRKNAVTACEALLKRRPESAHARLYLATLLFKQEQYGPALDEYNRIAELKTAPEYARAQALVGAAVAKFRAAKKEAQAAAIAESERILKNAQEINDTADVRANLAIAKSWTKDGILTAEADINKALTGDPPPAMSALGQVYFLKGIHGARTGTALTALMEFERAKAVNPSWKGLEDVKRRVLIAAVLQKDLDVSAKTDLIEKIRQRLQSFGSDRSVGLNAIGLAYYSMRNSPDFFRNHYLSALEAFKSATATTQSNPDGYFNMAQLYEEKIQELTKALVGQVSGLNGETPTPSPWATGDVKSRFLQQDYDKLSEIRSLLNELDSMWGQFTARVKCENDVKVRGLLSHAITLRRRFWISPDVNELTRQNLLDRAMNVVDQCVRLTPENGQISFMRGLIYLDRGDRTMARKAFLDAREKKFVSADLDSMIAKIEEQPKLVNAGRIPGARPFGECMSISATIVNATPSGLRSVRVKVAGKQVPTLMGGSQVFIFPIKADLTDGKHEIVIEIDESGQTIVLPAFAFAVDQKPPMLTIGPEPPGPVKPAAIWNLLLKDEGSGGVDLGTLNIKIQSIGGMPLSVQLVQNGRYKQSLPRINVQADTPITTESFQIATPSDLANGNYKLSIEVKDTAGNLLSDFKNYTVKGDAK